jgi:hypothetical protein
VRDSSARTVSIASPREVNASAGSERACSARPSESSCSGVIGSVVARRISARQHRSPSGSRTRPTVDRARPTYSSARESQYRRSPGRTALRRTPSNAARKTAAPSRRAGSHEGERSDAAARLPSSCAITRWTAAIGAT